ncbi:MAG: F0F1 ATP synthase subunit gamma, partial [Anaerolineales bacterium]
MVQDIERVQSRLKNIRTVEPILGALRTISLGTWQRAQSRRKGLRDYSDRLLALLPPILPELEEPQPFWRRLPYVRRVLSSDQGEDAVAGQAAAVVIGSERGLCGQYNDVVLKRAAQYLEERATGGAKVTLIAMGAKVVKGLRDQGRALARAHSRSATALPSFSMALEWTDEWLTRYEAYELDAVDIIYNAYQGVAQYTPTVTRLIPPELPSNMSGDGAASSGAGPRDVIIETDPFSLYTRIVEQWTAIGFYRLLLEATASEHSARFQLMESATQNVGQLVDELTQTLQSARRQAITQEMQELA